MTYTFGDWQAGRPMPKGYDVADCVRDGWSKVEIDTLIRATVRPWGAPPPEPEPPAPPEPPRKGRTYDELVAAAKALNEDDVEGLEAILAEAKHLKGVKQDHILRVLKSSVSTGITALRRQMRESGEEERGVDHLDLARRTVRAIGSENIICVSQAIWMWSSRGVWSQQDERLVKQRVQRTLEAEGLPVNSTLVNGVSEVLKTEIFKEGHRFNLGETETVNCLNGQVVPDERGWRLEPHCREHYRTTQIPVTFDPEAKAPRFEKFLHDVFRDDDDFDDKISATLEMMGYTLMSHARHELFALLIGNGQNGKSVLLHVLERMCGIDNVAGVQPSNFDRSFQRAHLDQKLANIVTEIKQGEVIADAELKGIVSGEKSTVEHKFQNPFDMHPFATIWLGTNHMPHTRDFSDGLFRRALILQFNRTFTDEEKNPRLKIELEEELPGIVNLALDAYRRATMPGSNGFTKPPSSEKAKAEWRLEADQVAMFVEECCVRVTGKMEGATTLFAEYQRWATGAGISKTMSAKGLRDRLTKLGFGSHRDHNGRYVTGIMLRPTSSGMYDGPF